MNNTSFFSDFKKKYENHFFWMSLIADVIAVTVFFKDVLVATVGLSTMVISDSPSTTILPTLSRSDAAIITGTFAISIIGTTIYLSVRKSKSTKEPWPYILGGGLSLLIAAGYFRLWLGENWWLWIFSSAVVISAITTIALYKAATIPDIYRVGCAGITLCLITMTGLLLAITGLIDEGQKTYPPPASAYEIPEPTEPIFLKTTQSIPSATTILEPENPNGYISYDLINAGWFPIVNGLASNGFDEATNEKSVWGNTERLKLFQEMGRITSFEMFYNHPQKCNSNDLRDAYVQIIFFQTSTGAKQFFDWANKGENVTFIYTVGNNAYVYYANEAVEGDTCRINYASTTFQRNNVIARARVRGVEGKMDYTTLESLSLKMAQFIDEQLMSNAQ